MSWFRIDDGFYDHPKVVAAGNAAVGLWVRCGVYSSAKDLDGAIPLGKVHELGSRREIEMLSATRLWVETDAGVLIPDFLDYNPSKADTDHRRKIDAERKRRARGYGAAAVEHHSTNGQFVGRVSE